MSETLDPARDIATMDSEFVLNDLIAAERKLERLTEEEEGCRQGEAVIEREHVLFDPAARSLSEETPLRDIKIHAEEENTCRVSAFSAANRS